MQPPILDFDAAAEAIVEPSQLAERTDVPRVAILTWFKEIVDDLARSGHRLHEVQLGPISLGIHEVEIEGQPTVVAELPIGAPTAAIMLEHVIALGCDTIMVVGAARGLATSMNQGTIVVPSEAMRDEGTSYHYLPPNTPAKPDREVAGALVEVLRKRGLTFTRGRTWSTDAVFRATTDLAHRRTDQGAITIEMEAAALFAVAAFRSVRLAHLMYVSDVIGATEGGEAAVMTLHNVRRTLFGFASEALRSL